MKILYALLFSQIIFSQLPVTSFYPTSGASGTQFGNGVSIFNNEVVVSSTTQVTPSPNQIGKVYVFSINNTLNQTDVLIENDVNNYDLYGNSISNENDKIAVGAQNQGANNSNTGAVYLYRKVNGNYQFHQKITSINNTVNDNFGRYVKLFNGRLYISAKNNVYVFDLTNENWTLTQTLSVENETALGRKIEVSNNQLLIYPGTVNGYSSKIYNFTLVNNLWTYQSTFNFNPELIYNFKLFNSQLYILNNASNQVLIYDFFNGNWILNSSFQKPANDQVYDEIVVNNDNIFLGSNWYILQMQRKFPVLHFRKIEDVWTAQPSIISHEINNQVDDHFGSSMALQGNQLIIGCKGERNGAVFLTGKAYYVDMSLGIDQKDLNSLYFYPNPTKDFITLSSDFIDSVEKIEVYQLDGKMIRSIEMHFNSISLKEFSRGIYLFKIISKDSSVTVKKVIKE